MTLERLGASLADRYRIERELGQGGMATVYLAQDLKHNRKVAIKVLKPELAAVLGAERFVQEITTTAQLQHPNILPLFDSGRTGGKGDGRPDEFLYYVMPYVEGETLRQKLNRDTQLGIDEAVKITTEVADALEYAHAHGVVHRDIKPENILLHAGRPMVADFGIALAVSAAAGGRMTETGLSLGTPHYMSPEQATADKTITARSDIYSLASVLYEMLTGEPPHMGNSAQQIIMKIIAEPVQPATALRKSVPPHVAAALSQALEKLPADRFDTARAFAEALANPAFTGHGRQTAAPLIGMRRRWVAWTGWVAAAVALLVFAVLRRAPAPEPPALRRMYLLFPDSLRPVTTQGNTFALSPDADMLVYTTGTRTRSLLAVKRAADLDPTELVGSDEAKGPVISPDGKYVLFVRTNFTVGPLQVLPLTGTGGSARTLVQDSVLLGASWGDDGYVYYSRNGSILRVPPADGVADTLARADGATRYVRPVAVPGGRGVLFAGVDGTGTATTYSLKPGSRVPRKIGADRVWAILESGYLLLSGPESNSLMAVRFDLDRLETIGDPAPLAASPRASASANIDAAVSSGGGTMVFWTSERQAGQVYWVDRHGRATVIDPGWNDGDGDFQTPALSPDGRRLAIGKGRSLEVKQLDQGPATRIARDSAQLLWRPAWSRDGRYVAYYRASQPDSMWVRRADGVGNATSLVSDPRGVAAAEWTPDGKWILYRTSVEASVTGSDVLAVRTSGDTTPVPLLTTPSNELTPEVSPDGRWLAYSSSESGSLEVWVRPFPNTQDARVQVSTRGGVQPRWAHSGRELFYVSGDGYLVAVRVSTNPAFSVSAADTLFPLDQFVHGSQFMKEYDVTKDDQRFVMVGAESGPIRFVEVDGIQSLLPVKK